MPKGRSTNHSIEKTFFENGLQHGINSFKLNNTSKEINVLVEKLKNECIVRLQQQLDSKKGMNISVESPKCCKNYAQLNVDRSVPLRQYFGKDCGKSGDEGVLRWSYGVGSGSHTVGGDTITTKTKPLTKNMQQMCELLQKMSKLLNIKECRKNIDFNHVTVLHYMMHGRNKRINLKPHCDVEMTASNKFKESNSQEEGTPTIVLTLNDTKTIKIYKRSTLDGTRFEEDIDEVASMELNHGDLYFLHPNDERVINRRCKDKGSGKFIKEEFASQFKHGVTCKLDDYNNKETSRLVLSICFRQSRIKNTYCKRTHVLINSEGNVVNNDNRTTSMVERNVLISKRRLEKEKPGNLNRIDKKLKRFT